VLEVRREVFVAHELAVEAILVERPDAIFVQSESIEHFHATGGAAQHEADRLNALKYLSLDLTLGRELGPGMAGLLNQNGVTSNELSFFRERRAVGHRWLGLDYYPTCEHRVASTGRRTVSRSPRGLNSLAREYYNRYQIPLFHCETNRVPRFAEDWLAEQWSDMRALMSSGVPVHGFTWYSLTDQIDWQHALRLERNDLHPVGLFDLDRRIRPVGEAYHKLMMDWQYILPTSSVCLRVPVKRPSEYAPVDDHLIRLADERERRRAALTNTVVEGHG
jgi:hypothetical protein